MMINEKYHQTYLLFEPSVLAHVMAHGYLAGY